MNYKTYLFDFDYTLADSSRGIVKCFRIVLTRHQYLTVTDEAIKRTIGKTLEESFSILTGITDPIQLEAFRQEYRLEADVHMNVNTQLFPDTLSTLKELKKRSARIGIISTKYRFRILSFLEEYQPEDFLDIVVGGEDVKAAKLLKEYDRVVLACGAKNPRDIKAPGRDAKGIYFAVDFLKATTKSLLDSELKDNQYISAKGKRVVIIGGGDTGNDCVGTSIRHGAASVTQLEMMPKAPDTRAENNPWPEWPKVCKTDYGQEEAIAVFGHDPRIYQTTVKEFLKDKNGNLCGLVTVKLESKKDEKTGRMMMAEVPGSEQKMDADLVLIAAGFLGTENYIANAFGVDLNARTNVATTEGAYATNVKNVFTAGDMHRGQSLVVWAIREGREAAREVDESLMGYSYLSVQ